MIYQLVFIVSLIDEKKKILGIDIYVVFVEVKVDSSVNVLLR